MSLIEDLGQLNTEMESLIPQEFQDQMEQSTLDLINSNIVDRALKPGDTIPDFVLPNAIGQPIKIQDILKSGPVVLSFYRGGWCPYCSLELRALQRSLPLFKTFGATLVALTPETPSHALSTLEKKQLSFEILSDIGNAIAREFGLVFTLPEKLRPIYQKLGIDLEAANGNQTFELPIPATYVVNQDGVIVYAFVDPDYTKRLEPDIIVSVLENIRAFV